MKRRTLFLTLAGAAAVMPSTSSAQRIVRVGFVIPGAAPTDKTALGHSVLGGLAKAGYVDGKNMIFEPRGADGRFERLPALIAELVAAKADVIITSSFPAAVAAKEGTTLPIVAINCGDPVGAGLVPSLARPGGHVTGVSDVSAELTPKRMELLRALSPSLDRIGIMWNDGDHAMQLRAQASEAGAKTMSIGVEKLALHSPGDFDKAFAELAAEKPGALVVVADTLTIVNSLRIFDYARAQKLPVIYEMDFLAEAGGLIS